jgi:hypothetical protein
VARWQGGKVAKGVGKGAKCLWFSFLAEPTRLLPQSLVYLAIMEPRHFPSLRTLCDCLHLRYDRFEILWNKTHTHILSFNQPELSWITTTLKHYFPTNNPEVSVEKLYDFGFDMKTATTLHEQTIKYSHIHSISLITTWMHNTVAFERKCGILYRPLTPEYAALGSMNDKRCLSSEVGIQGHFIINIRKANGAPSGQG